MQVGSCARDNGTDEHGQTALHIAAANGFAHAVALLVNDGADLALRDQDDKAALLRRHDR